MLLYLMNNIGIAYTAKEISINTRCTESRTRKHINDMVDEEIVEARGENPTYYGFVGITCQFKKRCKPKPVGGELCETFANRCQRRERYLDENAEVL